MLLDLILNKDLILKYVSEEQIFEYYLGIPVSLERKYRNPLRLNDKNEGSCCFYVRNNTLFFKDFAWKEFNCFQCVMEKHTLDYKDALRRIAQDLIIKTGTTIGTTNTSKVVDSKKASSSVFKIKTKPFTKEELAFWNVGGLEVTQEDLQSGGIYSVKTLWEDSYVQEHLEMVFAYVENNEVRQLYFPNNKGTSRRRFRNQKDFKTGGWSNLDPKAEYVVCTKSFKDMFILRMFGVNAIYIVNEKILLEEAYMNKLQSVYRFIGFLLDNDYTGKRQLIQYKRKYPHITPMLFDCNEGKDTYDVLKQFGKQYLIDLIKYVKERFL